MHVADDLFYEMLEGNCLVRHNHHLLQGAHLAEGSHACPTNTMNDSSMKQFEDYGRMLEISDVVVV